MSWIMSSYQPFLRAQIHVAFKMIIKLDYIEK